MIELRNREESGWGPNAVFRFPQQGGTGSIWKGVCGLLPQQKFRFGERGRVVSVAAKDKVLSFADGSSVRYNKVSGMPAYRSSLFLSIVLTVLTVVMCVAYS